MDMMNLKKEKEMKNKKLIINAANDTPHHTFFTNNHRSTFKK